MTDAPIDGLEALANRVARAKRTVPPPRHPRTPSDPQAETTPSPTPEVTEAATGAPAPSRPRRPASPPAPGQSSANKANDDVLKALPDAPTVMLGARVRVPLDDLLTDLVHEARHHQVRTSKVELVELALLSLVGVDGATIAERVREFRSQTGRYMVRR